MNTHLTTHSTAPNATENAARTPAVSAAPIARARAALARRFSAVTRPDAGMSTVEYSTVYFYNRGNACSASTYSAEVIASNRRVDQHRAPALGVRTTMQRTRI